MPPSRLLALVLMRTVAAFAVMTALLHDAVASGLEMPDQPVRLLVDYSAKPDPQQLAAFNLCILDPAAEVDLRPPHEMGNTMLAYVSTVELRPESPHAAQAKARGVSVLERNEGWASDVLDVTNPAWIEFVINDIAAPAIAKGYDGLFLDTLDSVALIAKKDPAKKDVCHRALIDLIHRLRQRFPDKMIVLNRGFDVVPEVRRDIQGVMAEGLYQSWNPSSKEFHAVAAKNQEWLLSRLQEVSKAGLRVFVLDYVPAEERELAMTTAGKIASHGFVPFVSTPELSGLALAPFRETPRRILVLHGWKQEEHGRPPFEADTLTADYLQMPLEYFGMEVDFLNITNKPLPAQVADRYRGIVLDQEMKLPVDMEEAFADWLLLQSRLGVKLLFTGEMPFHREHVWQRVVNELGMHGEHRHVKLNGKPHLLHTDKELMHGEVPVEPMTTEFRALAAPPNARVGLSLEGEDIEGHTLRFDPVFLAGWGGALLRPYVLFTGMPGQMFTYCDLYKFTAKWLDLPASIPMPDTTTRDGQRIFYTHIDGDGFVSRSALPGNPICGEAIRDHILKKYPFPVTISVIEAEIEAQMVGLDPANVGRYREAAKSSFELPNVQAASHSWSHPFRWLDFDPADETKYATRGLVLKPWANYNEITMEREVRGSINYINDNLLPAGKRVELMLWSGNCRPGHEALRICKEMGVENMNGGTTVLSRLYPGITSVSPRHTFWDDEMQVFGANQNEFMYANGWLGPFFGGFANLIDTLERTEKPRRLKPVNVYYHFYSATYVSSLRALEKILNWCQDQPLHSVTALQYAGLVRDAYRTRIYEVAPQHWLISNAGNLRTFRFGTNAGTPDMTLSKGITGYVIDNDQLYVHTRGLPVTEIVLSDKLPPQLHLAQSSAEIDFSTLSATSAEFTVKDLRPVQTTFAGISPHSACEINVNGQTMTLKADESGQLPLNLPANARVRLVLPPDNYAAQN